MRNTEIRNLSKESWHRWRRLTVIMLSAGTVTGCSDLLDVNLPTRVAEETLTDPIMAPVLVAGAIGDFECAYAEFIHATGLWADEFINAAGWSDTREWSTRAGHMISGTTACPTVLFRGNFGVYRPMQTARYQAQTAYKHITDYPDAAVPLKAKYLATTAAYAGYALTLLGEAWCQGAIDGGPLISSSEVLGLAEEWFTKAIDHATTASDPTMLNMARVGRARARIDLGKDAEAAADAGAVPAGFVVNATYSSTIPRRANHVYLNNNLNQAESVDPRFRNLTVDGVPDPRVPVQNMNRMGNDAGTPLWVQLKYPAISTPIPIATWDEAQLIIAEAQGGQAAVDAINRIRTKYSLPQFAGGDDATILAQLIEERRRTLFMQGHNLSDHLRFGLPFETGVDHKGVPFSDYTCIPLPLAETIGAP